jgi:hypothetical protein
LPKTKTEILEAATVLGVRLEVAGAFIAYQNFNNWRMNGHAIVDWHKALVGFARADHTRQQELRTDGITNAEFWAFVDAEHIEHATANAWISAMQKRNYKLLNPANGRLEPVRYFKAALRAFVNSDLNPVLESIGHYDE